jgi:hypothetical protein
MEMSLHFLVFLQDQNSPVGRYKTIVVAVNNPQDIPVHPVRVWVQEWLFALMPPGP